jgi:phasin
MLDSAANVEAGTETSKEAATSFAFPQFEIPKIEVPGSIREVAATWVSQSKGNFEKAISAADGMRETLGNSCLSAAQCAADCTAKVNEVIHKNTIAAFDLVRDMIAAKSLSEAFEISTTEMRKRADALVTENQELWILMQKLAVEVMKPMTSNIPKLFEFHG